MNLFAGLEKFGILGEEDVDITKEEKKKKKEAEEAAKKQQLVEPLTEKDFLLDKKVLCPVCDKNFTTKMVKTGKAKRLEPDSDLRPNFEGIDIIKYDATCCPYCGYAALNRDFEHISTTQRKLIREQVMKNYKPQEVEPHETYTYEEAIDQLKLALLSSMAKRAKMSEKAYICLKISWLIREELKDFPTGGVEFQVKKKEKQQEFVGFYQQAFEGFLKAESTELPPFCGMDTVTLDFMLANMAMPMKRYDVASKLVGRLLQSQSTPSRVKEKCVILKDEILEERRKQKAEEAAKEKELAKQQEPVKRG